MFTSRLLLSCLEDGWDASYNRLLTRIWNHILYLEDVVWWTHSYDRQFQEFFLWFIIIQMLSQILIFVNEFNTWLRFPSMFNHPALFSLTLFYVHLLAYILLYFCTPVDLISQNISLCTFWKFFPHFQEVISWIETCIIQF